MFWVRQKTQQDIFLEAHFRIFATKYKAMDGLDMGITLTLYDAFTNPARGISGSMNGLGSQARAMADTVNGAFNGSVNSVIDAQGRLRDAQGRFLKNSASSIQESFSSIIGSAVLASPFIIATDRARQFEQQLSNIKSLGTLQEDMASVEALAKEMGAKTKFSAFEAAQGIEELLKAGVDMKDVMNKNGLSGALDLAVAGNLRLADAAEIASTALNAFRSDAMNIRQAGDILAGAANASATDVTTLRLSLAAVSAVASGIGLNFKDTNTALAVFANNGLKGSDAGTSLKTMLMNLQPRTKEQIATFQQLGLMTANGANAFFDASGNIKDMASISGLLNQQLKHLTPQQRAFALETMFGSDAVRAANILFKEGAEGINKMQKAMTKFTVASVARDRLNNLNGALEMLWGSIDTILIEVGQMFLPTLTRLTQGLNVVADAFQTLVSNDIAKYFILATSSFASFVVLFGVVIPFLQSTIPIFQSMVGLVRTLTAVAWQSALAFAPYIAIGGVIIFAYKAFSSFKDVLEGTTKPAQGLLGFMQRLGAVMWSVGQVISSWDGKSFDLGGAEAQLQALGILDIVKAISTYTVRAIEFVKGVGSGIYSVFAGVASVFQYVVKGVQSFLQVFGVQNASLQKATSLAQGWINAGKIVGYVLGTVLVGATIALTASLGSMAVAMIAATWPVLAVVGAVSAVVTAILYWDSITKWFGNQFSIVMKSINVAMSQAGQWISGVLDNIAQWFSNSFNTIKAYAYSFAQTIINFVSAIPSYIITALQEGFNFIGYFFTAVIPYALGFVLGFGLTLISKLPMYISTAFDTAFELAYQAITVWLPNAVIAIANFAQYTANAMYSGVIKAKDYFVQGFFYITQQISNFAMYAYDTITSWIRNAFQTAVSYAYFAFTEGIPQIVSTIYNFLIWAVTEVPVMLWTGFNNALIWIGETIIGFFNSATSYFYDAGVSLMGAVWDGLKSVWEDVKAWFQEVWDYATMGFSAGANVLETQAIGSLDPNTSTAEPNYNTEIARKNAEIKNYQFQRTNNASQNVINNIQNAPESLNVTLDMGNGDQFHKVLSMQEALAQARK